MFVYSEQKLFSFLVTNFFSDSSQIQAFETRNVTNLNTIKEQPVVYFVMEDVTFWPGRASLW